MGWRGAGGAMQHVPHCAMVHRWLAALSAQSAMPFVCDTGTREHTNIERKIEIAGVTPKLKFVAGGRLLSRGIRFCSRWPAFLLIETASDQAGNLQAGTFDRVSFHCIENASRWPAAGDR